MNRSTHRIEEVAEHPVDWWGGHGDVRSGAQGLEIVHPSYRVLAADERGRTEERLTPVYPVTEGVGQAALARVTDEVRTRALRP